MTQAQIKRYLSNNRRQYMRKFTTPVQNVQQLSINIHDARKASGLSQEELAKETGLSRSWINRLETGKITNPGFNDILSVYKVLHISDTIAYDAPEPEPRNDKPVKRTIAAHTQAIDQIGKLTTPLLKEAAISSSILKSLPLPPEIQSSMNIILKTFKQAADETQQRAQQIDNPSSDQSHLR